MNLTLPFVTDSRTAETKAGDSRPAPCCAAFSNARTLLPWITGAAYNYGDGEVWPEWKFMTLRLLARRVALAIGLHSRKKARRLGQVWPAVSPTMIGELRAANIVEMVERLDEQNIPGALVDCGVWRGGSTMLMRAASLNRTVYCCDTFDGFPPEDAKREKVMCPAALRVPQSQVQANFQKFGVPLEGVQFLQGRVQETLSQITEPVALLRVDVDLYEPTLACLETIHPLMSPSAIVIVDDYGVPYYGCRQAVDEFRVTNQSGQLHWIDTDGVWWTKQHNDPSSPTAAGGNGGAERKT